jgi:hypothetical protein
LAGTVDPSRGREEAGFRINRAVSTLFLEAQAIFTAYAPHLDGGFDDHARRQIMDELVHGHPLSRRHLPGRSVPGASGAQPPGGVGRLLTLAQAYVEQTLRANRRDDGRFRNAQNVAQEPAYAELVPGERDLILDLFEGSQVLIRAPLASLWIGAGEGLATGSQMGMGDVFVIWRLLRYNHRPKTALLCWLRTFTVIPKDAFPTNWMNRSL